LLSADQVYTNALLTGANTFDHAKVAKDAKAYKLSGVFAKVAVKG